MLKAFLESHLFVPFSQEDRVSDGVGLGMSMVENLVALLIDGIKVESHLGEGTTIMVSIPIRLAGKQATLEMKVARLVRESIDSGGIASDCRTNISCLP
jgi:nitrogen-specific signal transduction histidine kinase